MTRTKSNRLAVALVAASLLAACSGGMPEPTSTEEPPRPAPGATAAAPAAPALPPALPVAVAAQPVAAAPAAPVAEPVPVAEVPVADEPEAAPEPEPAVTPEPVEEPEPEPVVVPEPIEPEPPVEPEPVLAGLYEPCDAPADCQSGRCGAKPATYVGEPFSSFCISTYRADLEACRVSPECSGGLCTSGGWCTCVASLCNVNRLH